LLDTERSSSRSTVGTVLRTSLREGSNLAGIFTLHDMTETEFPKLWIQKLILACRIVDVHSAFCETVCMSEIYFSFFSVP